MPTILQNHYVLAVHNIRESARFYVDVLDFKIHAEPHGWIFVTRDNCMIMLGECPGETPVSELGDHSYFAYLRVDDVDACYARAQQRGGLFTQPVADKPWNMREFGVKSPDGHRIMIGQIINAPAKSTIPGGRHTAVNADLTASTFTDVCLRDADFEDVNLAGSSFRDVNLSQARFENINLSGVAIQHANLDGMTLDGILVTDLLAAHRRLQAGEIPPP